MSTERTPGQVLWEIEFEGYGDTWDEQPPKIKSEYEQRAKAVIADYQQKESKRDQDKVREFIRRVRELEDEVEVQHQVIRAKEDRIKRLEEFIKRWEPETGDSHDLICELSLYGGSRKCTCGYFEARKALNL